MAIKHFGLFFAGAASAGQTFVDYQGGKNNIFWLRVGESSGTTAVDSSTNGNNGTYDGDFALSETGLVTDDSNAAVKLNLTDLIFDPDKKNSGITLSNGNKTAGPSTAENSVLSTIGKSSGVLQFQVTPAWTGNQYVVVGIATSTFDYTSSPLFLGQNDGGSLQSVSLLLSSAIPDEIYVNTIDGYSTSNPVGTTSSGDPIQVVVDLDSSQNTITWYDGKNILGTADLPSGQTWFPAVTCNTPPNDVIYDIEGLAFADVIPAADPWVGGGISLDYISDISTAGTTGYTIAFADKADAIRNSSTTLQKILNLSDYIDGIQISYDLGDIKVTHGTETKSFTKDLTAEVVYRWMISYNATSKALSVYINGILLSTQVFSAALVMPEALTVNGDIIREFAGGFDANPLTFGGSDYQPDDLNKAVEISGTDSNSGVLINTAGGAWLEVTLPYVVVIGDSIAEGHPALHGRLHPSGSPGYDPNYASEAGQLNYELAREWNAPVINQGIGGETTQDVRDRWSRDALAQTYDPGDGRGSDTLEFGGQKPFAIYLHIGINDVFLAVSASTIKSNFEFFAQSCASNGIKLILANIGPESNYDSTKIALATEVNDWLDTTFKAAYPEVDIIDYLDWGSDGTGDYNTLKSGNYADSVHPNKAGYVNYAAYVMDRITKSIYLKEIFLNSTLDLVGSTPSGFSRATGFTFNGDSYTVASDDVVSITLDALTDIDKPVYRLTATAYTVVTGSSYWGYAEVYVTLQAQVATKYVINNTVNVINDEWSFVEGPTDAGDITTDYGFFS